MTDWPDCHVCGETCVPADDFDCDRDEAEWLCPECAPDFVLANATTHVSVEDPLA